MRTPTFGAGPALAAIVLLSLAAGPAARAQQGVVKVTGTLHPLSLTREDLAKMPRTRLTATARDETATYEGVSMREILARAGVPAGEALRGPELAKVVMLTGADGYRVAFSLAEFDPAFTDRARLLADTKDGQPLGGTAAPYPLILEGEKRPARWVRQVVSLEVVTP
jgi:DMSO/TMAO reductase YedYZ molybdopterin-dependent catalytic subunit